MHEAEECAPHEISKTGEGHQGNRQIKQVARLRLGFAALFEDATMQKLIETLAFTRAFENPIQGIQPQRSLQIHVAQRRLQVLSHQGEIHIVVFEFARRDCAEVLHQEKVDLVASRIGPGGTGKKVAKQFQKPILIGEGTGLQKLAQLMDLDALVHFLEPLRGLLDRFAAGRVSARFQIGTRLHLDDEFARDFKIDRVEPAGRCPLGGKVWCWRCCHDFTIQLGTSPIKRAATTVLPGWYCTATTAASTSKEPSELRRRSTSANSRGVAQANKTSRGVPNSMTVLSVKGRALEPGSPPRANCTGMRTGAASGKKRASPATVPAPCAPRAAAVACCAKAFAPFCRESA